MVIETEKSSKWIRREIDTLSKLDSKTKKKFKEVIKN
jgi:hypothetical protein